MRRVARLQYPTAGRGFGAETAGRFDEQELSPDLAGYVLDEPPSCAPAGTVVAWGYLVVKSGTLGEPEGNRAVPEPPRRNGQPMLRLRPVGRLVPVAMPATAPGATPAVCTLRPVCSGRAYRITSPPGRGLVTPELAQALETVCERYAHQRGFTPEQPLEIRFARGFQAGSYGHGEGRAADIAAVGGKTLRAWKEEWDAVVVGAESLPEGQRAEAVAAEQKRNLGYGLYRALQEQGGWRVNPDGWRPYRGVMQLFGPWTATEGPWKAMKIRDPNPYQQQRLEDQEWVFRAHQDHIHVAR